MISHCPINPFLGGFKVPVDNGVPVADLLDTLPSGGDSHVKIWGVF